MATTPLRTRKAVLYFKIETTAGVDPVPTGTNAIYVEVTGSPCQPQAERIQTNYVASSLDKSASLIGGVKCNMSFTVPIATAAAANGPGVLPDWDSLMQVCGFLGTATKTNLVTAAITIGFTTGSPNTITDSGSGLAAATVGTVLTVIDTNGVNSGECIVTTSAAGVLGVTKTDGTSAGFTAQTAGAGFPVTIVYGVAGATATAGTTTAFTAGASWSGTSEIYRHQPVLLSANPATPAWAFIQDYTTGKVATITDLMGSTLSAVTVASIPANVTYLPTSVNANLKTGTAYLYVDGVCWQAVGLTGTWQVTHTTANIGRMQFQLSGIFQAKIDATLPAYTPPTVTTSIYRGGVTLLNRIAAASKSLMFKSNNQVINPPNPASSQGFDPGVILSRKFEGSIDPQDTLVATRDIMTYFKNGIQVALHARYGTVPGARVGQTCPTVKYIQHAPQDDGGIQRTPTSFECNGVDDGSISLTIY